MTKITIHPVAIDMEELVTAVARLLCLAKLAESEREQDAYLRSASEFSAILSLDANRVQAMAQEIINHATKEARKIAAARWN